MEWVHALAPEANIVLLETGNSSFPTALTAIANSGFTTTLEGYGLPTSSVSVVTSSWGSGTLGIEGGSDTYASNVTYVVSAGDYYVKPGQPAQAVPASSVVAAGYSQLTLNAAGNYGSDAAVFGGTAADGRPFASGGGGVDGSGSQPGYQETVPGTVPGPTPRTTELSPMLASTGLKARATSCTIPT